MIQSSEALREATPRLPGGQSIKLIQAQSAGWIDARVRRKPNEGGAPLVSGAILAAVTATVRQNRRRLSPESAPNRASLAIVFERWTRFAYRISRDSLRLGHRLRWTTARGMI